MTDRTKNNGFLVVVQKHVTQYKFITDFYRSKY